MSDATIDALTGNRNAHYEPFGWHQWPEHPWLSYQFRRILGETQEGGGAVSECFLAASRMVPGDRESWHREWTRVADHNRARGEEAEALGHVETAKACWLRATDYYRSAEFWLAPNDPRRIATFDRVEECFQSAGRWFRPPLEKVEVPYEDTNLPAYFLASPWTSQRQPVLVAFGGLDSFKDELLFMTARGALERGIACFLVDGPGQGASLRRRNLHTRHDYEVPVGACVDYLESRADIDASRIAVVGSSLGGYYAARAACFEPRLAAAISHGAIWGVNDLWEEQREDHGLAAHVKWVFGTDSMDEAIARGERFTLEGVLEEMKCPYLIVHGGHDVLGVRQAQRVFDAARAAGVDVTLRFVEPDETGAEHCQHDNPSIGQELIGDWLADCFGIDQRGLAR